MTLYTSDPLRDGRWDRFVDRNPRASVFHQLGWLKALHETYKYEPLVLTTTPDGEALRNGIVLCRVSSWITGTRLVSLPFADHCDLLLDQESDMAEVVEWLKGECSRKKIEYVEFRPLRSSSQSGFGLSALVSTSAYYYHKLDLSPPLERIFTGLHKDSLQRRIRHAEREGLTQEIGRSHELMERFYRLLILTRRRHGLLPQPKAWFTNLLGQMRDACQIRVASRHGKDLAALLTLRHGSVVTYKYGCSDEQMHHFGAMPFLFWGLIEESKAQGTETIDFGRSDLGQQGLITFKDRFGTTRTEISYYRYTKQKQANRKRISEWKPLKRLFSMLPDSLSATAGRVLYRHMG